MTFKSPTRGHNTIDSYLNTKVFLSYLFIVCICHVVILLNVFFKCGQKVFNVKLNIIFYSMGFNCLYEAKFHIKIGYGKHVKHKTIKHNINKLHF